MLLGRHYRFPHSYWPSYEEQVISTAVYLNVWDTKLRSQSENTYIQRKKNKQFFNLIQLKEFNFFFFTFQMDISLSLIQTHERETHKCLYTSICLSRKRMREAFSASNYLVFLLLDYHIFGEQKCFCEMKNKIYHLDAKIKDIIQNCWYKTESRFISISHIYKLERILFCKLPWCL